MMRPLESCLRALLLMAWIVAVSGFAAAAPPYVITNDDSTFPFTVVSFFSQAPNGTLTFQQQVATIGTGIGGGFFGANRISVLNSGNQSCVFASEAGTHDIVG